MFAVCSVPIDQAMFGEASNLINTRISNEMLNQCTKEIVLIFIKIDDIQSLRMASYFT